MTNFNRDALAQLTPGELTSRLYALRATERQLLVEFLGYLGELDARRTYLELGFSSTFAFCTDHLGLTKSSAFRRTTAARLLLRFPVVAGYLADGRLGVTTLVEIRDVLSDESMPGILDRAAGRTEDEVKVLVAALRPRPAPPDLLRRLPERRESTAAGSSPEPQTTLPVRSGPEPQTSLPVNSEPALPNPARRPPTRPVTIEPISEELRVLRMTVGRAFVEDLEAVRNALSHQIPDRGLAAVLHECIRRTLREHARRRTGADEGRSPRKTAKPRGRYIAVAVRREVWSRDEGRCAFVSESGRRCGSSHQLEFHHLTPFAKGGPPTIGNLALRCSVHNQFHAEQDFGERRSAGVPAAGVGGRD